MGLVRSVNMMHPRTTSTSRQELSSPYVFRPILLTTYRGYAQCKP